MMTDGHRDNSVGERKLIWDEENRLLAVDDNGFVSNYWYDADGERTVKTSGEGEQVYVNSVFAGGRTNTAKFSLYVSPYLVANQGGRYTKHIYIGSQRIVSKLGDLDSYGSDPRRIPYAGSEADAVTVDYKGKYASQQQVIKDNYAAFDVPYNGEDNNDYVDGEGFCCNDGSVEAAQARVLARAKASNFQDADAYEKMQFYYHPDHLGSSSYITDLDGEVVQHIEYVPFGEVFIEERNNTWNTPYLFNAKEFDEETGLYYYGSRYYDPRLTIWITADPSQEKYPNVSTYNYCLNNPIKFSDDDGDSPISVLAKMAAKQGVKVAIKRYAKQQIEHRFKNYMSKNIAKQFAKDLDDILGTLDNTWWETGLELIPVAGDIYGGTKFGLKIAKAYEKLQDLENKYVKKIYDALPSSQKAKFKKAMRNAGVRDARKDQKLGVEDLGIPYQKGQKIDGHHEVPVKEDISRSSDPRNIKFMKKEEHQNIHSGDKSKYKSGSGN